MLGLLHKPERGWHAAQDKRRTEASRCLKGSSFQESTHCDQLSKTRHSTVGKMVPDIPVFCMLLFAHFWRNWV